MSVNCNSITSKVLFSGKPRAYDLLTMKKIALSNPLSRFKPVKIESSPHIKDSPGEVVVVPHQHHFELTINGKRAGIWEIVVQYGVPFQWQDFGKTYYINACKFKINRKFRKSANPKNWIAAAFRRAVHNNFLTKCFPGWLLESNVTNPAMKKIFEACHPVIRLVKYQDKEEDWQMHAFLD